MCKAYMNDTHKRFQVCLVFELLSSALVTKLKYFCNNELSLSNAQIMLISWATLGFSESSCHWKFSRMNWFNMITNQILEYRSWNSVTVLCLIFHNLNWWIPNINWKIFCFFIIRKNSCKLIFKQIEDTGN